MPDKKKPFTFIDLFSGIGGFRLAFERSGATCIFSSEINKFSRETYRANFYDTPEGDITKIPASSVPDHDILTAGFPCQPFSIAGVSKRNSLGQEHGFRDRTQGTLFFEIARIIEAKHPAVFLLENVKNLRSHNRGTTFRVIAETLTGLGYNVSTRVLDAANYVPQHRERIFVVGFRADISPNIEFEFPIPSKRTVRLADILEENVDDKYTLTDRLWKYLQDHKEKHRKKGNGFGYGLVDPNTDGVTRTLSARYYKDGSEILIRQDGKNPRRLTPRECARLMGFDDSFVIPVSDTQAYRQFGNSVVVPLVEDLAKNILFKLDKFKE